MPKKHSKGPSAKKADTSSPDNRHKPEENGSKKSGSPKQKKMAQSSTFTPVLFYVGLSVVIATAAIIFVSEDVQLYLVRLTQAGSDPLGTVLKSAEKETSQEKHSSPETVIQSKQENAESAKTDGNKDIKPETDSKPTESGKDKEANEDEQKEKMKVNREDYEKHDITNKDDFKIRKKLDAAELLTEKGDLNGAIQKFDSILKSHPESPRALWGKGMALDKLAEQRRSNALLEEAMQLMDKALRLPATPEPLLQTIATKLAQRQSFRGWAHKEAQTWKYLISKYPDNLEFRRKYGVSFLMMGKNDEARRVFKQILEKAPDDGFALVHLGFIMKVNDLNYAEAIPMMQQGIDSKAPGTQDGRFFYHLGDAYQRTNQTDKAMKVYQEAADLGLFLSRDQRSLYNAETKLTGRPWWTPEQTPYRKYLTMLENNWKTIRDEGLAQLDMNTGGFRPEEENLRETGDWKQLTLYQRGQKIEDNCRRVPQTCALMDQIPEAKGCTRGQIKFSVMHPGVHVWPHTGPTNCRLRAHLGLKIPEGPRIRVANETKTWIEGKFIIIDDSFEHEVWHNGTELRLILIVDFWHPDIPEHERRTLSPI